MKRTFHFFLLLAMAGMLLAASCDKNDNGVPTGELPDRIRVELRAVEQEMVSADHSFAFEFFENVFLEEAGDDDENFMVSPLSLSMALAMTSNGAAGETKSAIREALKLGAYPDEEVNGYYKKLKEALLKTDPSTKLSIANAIFTNKHIKIKPDFINTNASFYDATVKPVDFDDSRTVGIINGWASDNTNGLIEQVIDKTDPMDLMYLLNAIYFKGIWTTEFDPKETSKKPFTTASGVRTNVDMMHQTAKFNYMADEILQLVQLPYGNEAFSMMVMLPTEGKGLNDLIKATRQDGYWSNSRSRLREAEVVLSLPKFKTTYSTKLNDVLASMGMELAFTNSADFSGMSDHTAKIDLVKQDTYISTDEVGTEAAAVTTVGMVVTSMPLEPERVVFNANRPFLYLIQENSTGAILFMGAVKNFN